MALQADYEILIGGTRRRVGSHLVDLTQLEIMVAQARDRHQARGS